MTPTLSTLGDAYRFGRATLAATSPSANADTEHLLAFATGYDRLRLRSHPETVLPAQAQNHFQALIERRRQGEPVAYLIGQRGFMNLDLAVDENVLIPRPETEHLVEAALEHPIQTILELGTGSGCIAIALAHARPQAQIDAVDASAAALAVARRNAEQHQATHIHFHHGDWYGPVAGKRYSLIISNPPYIADTEPEPDQADARFEPRAALRAGPTGLEALTMIIRDAPMHLHRDGWLWLEHGYRQGPAVRSMLAEAGFSQIRTQQDLAGHERITGGCYC